MEAGKRIHLTTYAITKPFKPPAFCMELRKHLGNGRIQSIQQHEFERIVTLTISTREGNLQLVIELFGDGNIILVSPKNNIITALNYKRMRDRNILRNETFKPPPPSGKNPLHINRNDLDHLKNQDQLEIARALVRFLGIGGLYAEELLQRANIEKTTPSRNLTQQQLDNLHTQLNTMLTQLKEGQFNPTIILDKNNEYTDATPINLKRYADMKTEPHETFNETLDQYHTKTSHQQKATGAKQKHEQEHAKLKRILQEQQKTLDDSKKTKAQDKQIGDLIYAHFNELQQILQQIQEQKQLGKNWEQITEFLKSEKRADHTPYIYFDSLDAKNRVINISINSLTFPIRIDHSIQTNAAEYYERMKKAERKLQGAEKAAKETQTKIQELDEKWIREKEEAQQEAPSQLPKKAWYEKFRWLRSSEGFLIVAGKDATTNEILIKKHLEPHDIIFHADIVGAPFVVVKTEGKTVSEQVIQEAAQLAASYSRAWREMFDTLDVYWVLPNQVSKTPPSGQYLEKGSFIISGTKNYVRGVQLRTAIGLKKSDSQFSATGGPLATVAKLTNLYVEIRPGKQESRSLVKQIRRLLAEKAPKDRRQEILNLPDAELQPFIPFGRGEVTLK
jgi:predicted ribosome quality control (RQC) complex YloA/Tae2 family protein